MESWIGEINPVFYGMYYYNYVRMCESKNQYVYRFIFISEGTAGVQIGERTMNCGRGTMLYLRPGQYYNFSMPYGKFSLIHLFFDFFPCDILPRRGNETHCIFAPDFIPEFCSPSLTFIDAPLLNNSGVFDGSACRTLLEDMLRYDRSEPYAALYYKASLLKLIQMLLDSARSERTRDCSVVRKILAYIDSNPDKMDSPKTLSAIFCYHENYINRMVKQKTGMTLSDYIKRAKVRYAQRLLAETDMSVSQIAAELGYYDYSHFYKAYKSVTGIPPMRKH